MTGPEPTRRSFFSALTGLLAAVPFVGGAVVALRTALAPSGTTRPTRVPLCRVDEIPADDILVRSVSFEQRSGPVVEHVSRVVLVTRDPATPDSILAMSGECTHLSCPVQKRDVSSTGDDEAPLRCPCHGGAFSRTGEVLGGPPPAPLRRLAIELPQDGAGMIHLTDL